MKNTLKASFQKVSDAVGTHRRLREGIALLTCVAGVAGGFYAAEASKLLLGKDTGSSIGIAIGLLGLFFGGIIASHRVKLTSEKTP